MIPLDSTTVEAMHEIESGSVLEMIDSSSAQLLQELNSKRKKLRLLPFAIAGLGLGVFVLLSSDVAPWLKAGSLVLSLGLVILAHYRDVMNKTAVIFYDLDESVQVAYQKLHDAFELFRSCSGAWRIEAAGRVRDRKYHAGAGTLVNRKAVTLSKGQAPSVKTNVEVPKLPAGRRLLAFMPDRLLVFEAHVVGAIPYDQLRIHGAQTRFVEDGHVPSDAQVVDFTWRYVNKNGGPDRRFKNNRQLPVALYEELSLESTSGLNELFQFSRVAISGSLASAIGDLGRLARTKE